MENAQNDSLVGRRLGPYEIRELLGKGGMGAVYGGYEPSVGRKVAVKVLNQDLSKEAEYLERFQLEARVAANLIHPNIVTIYRFESQDDYYYIGMPLFPQGSLDDLITSLRERKMRLDPEEVSNILDKVADALDYAHQNGVIHRDIKPNNILFDSKRNPIIVDFGIVKLLNHEKLTQTDNIIGTQTYMSPEQWEGGMRRDIDGRADQYSLACTIYELLVGEPPFNGDNPLRLMYQHRSELPRPIHELRRDLPPQVSEVLNKALAKERDERYSTVSGFAKAFKEAIGEPPPPPPPPPPKDTEGASSNAKSSTPTLASSRLPIIIAVVVTLAVVIIGALVTIPPIVANQTATQVSLNQTATATQWTPTPTPTATPIPIPISVPMILGSLGINPSNGNVPIIIDTHTNTFRDTEADGQGMWGNDNLSEDSYSDFVFHANITGGETAEYCGLGFRWDGNGGYQVNISRAGNFWFSDLGAETWVNGNPAPIDTSETASNQLVIVAIDGVFTVYINDVLAAVYSDDTYPVGTLSLNAANPNATSARESCTFNDVWVWQPNNDVTITTGDLPLGVSDVINEIGYSRNSGQVLAFGQTHWLTQEANSGGGFDHSIVSPAADFVLHTTITTGDADDECDTYLRDSTDGLYVFKIRQAGIVEIWQRVGANPGTWTLLAQQNVTVPLDNTYDVVISGIGGTINAYVNTTTSENPTLAYHDADGFFASGQFSFAVWSPNNVNTPTCHYDDVWLWQPDASQTPTVAEIPSSVVSIVEGFGYVAENGQVGEFVSDVPSIYLHPIEGQTGWWEAYTLFNNYDDFIFHANIVLRQNDTCQIRFRHNDQAGNGYQINFWPSTEVVFDIYSAWVYDDLQRGFSGNIFAPETNTPNEVVLVVNDGTFSLYINDLQTPEFVFNETTHGNGTISVTGWSPDGANTDNAPTCAYSDLWVWQP
jgi:serine/threonine protein kinase